MSDVRVITQPIGGSALASAVAGGTLDYALMDAAPATPDDWATRVRAAADGAPDHWLENLRDAFGGAAARISRLEKTAVAGGAVVTTGQQAGLFGGPVYTWSKAVAALAMADALERATGTPVAPVFWAATDDADFAEADHTYIERDANVERLTLPPEHAEGHPMSAVPLLGSAELVARLRAACRSLAFADAWDAVANAYVEGQTVGSAYVQLLRALLEPLGIAVLDSSHAQVRKAGAATLRRALTRAERVEHALRDRHQWLEAHGYEPQVAHVPGLSTVFVTQDGAKDRVPVARAAAVAKSASDESLSPNVLLRPVMERAILPVACYVAGPGELAYFAQVPAVADALEVSRPVAVPRWSCTIVEPAVDRAMARLGVELDDVANGNALEARVARHDIPGEMQRVLHTLRASIHDAAAALHNADHERLLKPEIVDGARFQLEHRLDRLERRTAAAVKRRGTDALRDVALVRASLWPDGKRQERMLNFLPFLTRYGAALWEQMRQRATEHARDLVQGSTPHG